MVVKRSPLRSLKEIKAVAQKHWMVLPAEDALPILRALGVDPKLLKICERRRRIQQAVLALRESDHLGCVCIGKEHYDVYQIGSQDALCLSLECFGLNQILLLLCYHWLSSISAQPAGDM